MLNSKEYKGKDLENILLDISKDLEIPVEDIIYQFRSESSLFTKNVIVTVYKTEDITEYLNDLIIKIIKNMGLEEVSVEIISSQKNIIFNIMSNKNAVLIGKDGRNLDALQFYLKNVIYHQVGKEYNFIIDVENYKNKKQKKLIRLAHQLADEVNITNEEVVIRNLNSYERRLVHQELSKSDLITTHSEGEGLGRYLVISPKERN